MAFTIRVGILRPCLNDGDMKSWGMLILKTWIGPRSKDIEKKNQVSKRFEMHTPGAAPPAPPGRRRARRRGVF